MISMDYRDFREFLAILEQHDLLRRVKTEVDKNWELSCVSRWTFLGMPEDKRYAIFFENVKGFNIPVVVGAVAASYKTYAVALGIDPSKPRSDVIGSIRERWVKALRNPIKPRLVNGGACKEVIMKDEDVDIHFLPVPVLTPDKDGGEGYLTCAHHFTKDPQSGLRNVGIYRCMIRADKNKIGTMPSPRSHAMIHIKKNGAAGKSTDVAIALGADPTLAMTAGVPVPIGVDELDIAGGLVQEPLELVRCETVDLEVPASSEIIIEGKILAPNEYPYEEEGPFGEYTGYQGSPTISPVIHVTCITHRKAPIYHALLSEFAPSESSRLRTLYLESKIINDMNALGLPGIIDVYVPEAGQAGVIIVSIRKMYEGHPAQVANAIFSIIQPRYGKFVIITDDDIDIRNLESVMWAVVFRTALTPKKRNLWFLEGIRNHSLDYSAISSLNEKESADRMGVGVTIDATRPYRPYPVVALPPQKYLQIVKDEWEKYGLPSLENKEIPKCVLNEELNIREGISAYPKSHSQEM